MTRKNADATDNSDEKASSIALELQVSTAYDVDVINLLFALLNQ
jgi:hypothetical protein